MRPWPGIISNRPHVPGPGPGKLPRVCKYQHANINMFVSAWSCSPVAYFHTTKHPSTHTLPHAPLLVSACVQRQSQASSTATTHIAVRQHQPCSHCKMLACVRMRTLSTLQSVQQGQMQYIQQLAQLQSLRICFLSRQLSLTRTATSGPVIISQEFIQAWHSTNQAQTTDTQNLD